MEAIEHALDVLIGWSADKANDLNTFQVSLRAVVVYFVLIAYIRFGKKRFLSEATAFDAILAYMIGSIASRAISGTAPFFASLAGTFVLILVHWIISYLTRDWPSLGALIKGHDTILIRKGRIDRRALAKALMAIDDLKEDLRQHGIEDASKVKEARLERNGKLSIIEK